MWKILQNLGLVEPPSPAAGQESRVCLAGHWERPFPFAGSWLDALFQTHKHPLPASASPLQLQQLLGEAPQHSRDLGLYDKSSSTSQLTFLLPPSPGRLWGSHTELIVNEAEESLGFSGHSSPELLLLSWHTQSQHCREALSPPPTAPFSPKLRAVVKCNPLLKKSSLRACAGRKEKAPRGAGTQLQSLPSLQHSLSPGRVTLSSLCPYSHTFYSFSFKHTLFSLFSTCNSSMFRSFTKAN